MTSLLVDLDVLLSAPPELLRRLSSPTLFTQGRISPAEWNWLVSLGWSSDGSSWSLDDIEGIRIGESGTTWSTADLPAKRHDFWYALGRIFLLDPPFRAAADRDYLDGCLARVRLHLVGWNRRKAEARSWARYFGLRFFGRCAWVRDQALAALPRVGPPQ